MKKRIWLLLSVIVGQTLEVEKQNEFTEKPPGACKMITAADLRRRLEVLECGPGAQETKIFL